MKVEPVDRRGERLRIRPESEEDLWTLKIILRPGDYIIGKTYRDVAKGGRGEKEKRPIIVKIKIKNIEFQPFTGRLRVFGVIVEGPEEYGVKGKHQSILVSPGTEIIIERPGGWPAKTLERIRASGPSGRAIITAIDYDEYAIAKLVSYGVKIMVDSYIRLPGKDDPSRDQELSRIISKISREIIEIASDSNANIVVIAGPGPLKEYIADKVRSLAPSFKIILDEASRGGKGGIDEILRRPSIWRALKEYEITEAEKILSDVMKEAARGGGRIAIGPREVLAVSKMGAVEKLLLVDELIYSIDDTIREMVNTALEEAEKRGARIVMVPRDSPVGERLFLMGGILAVLRYEVPSRVRESMLDAGH